MRGVKGQVTMFFAIGIVLLIAIGILYVMISRANDAVVGTSIDIAANPALSNYVTSCLDTVVHDKLGALGNSGGIALLPATALNQYPHATLQIAGEPMVVLYGVTKNRRKLSDGDLVPEADAENRIDFAHMVTYCPYPTKITVDPNRDCYVLPSFADGYFGQTNLMPVCAKNGPNGIGSTVLCNSYPGSPPQRVPPSPASTPSVQELLTAQIQQQVDGCLSPQAFRETVGQGYTTASAANVSVMFTDSGILVNLTYNITLEGQTRSSAAVFNRRYQIRLLPMMQYALALAREETRDVSFSIAAIRDYSDKQRLPYEEGFTVRRQALGSSNLTDISPTEIFSRADLITITDERSELKGQPYSFSFLVEHRPPMLDMLQGRTCTVELGRDPDGQEVSMISRNVGCEIRDADDLRDME